MTIDERSLDHGTHCDSVFFLLPVSHEMTRSKSKGLSSKTKIRDSWFKSSVEAVCLPAATTRSPPLSHVENQTVVKYKSKAHKSKLTVTSFDHWSKTNDKNHGIETMGTERWQKLTLSTQNQRFLDKKTKLIQSKKKVWIFALKVTNPIFCFVLLFFVSFCSFLFCFVLICLVLVF